MNVLNKTQTPKSHKDGNSHLQPKKYTKKELGDLHNEMETRNHIIPIKRLCERLNTHVDKGITNEEAKKILESKGFNSLTPPAKTPEYVKLFMCMFSGFAALLWCCGILCFLIYLIEYFYEQTGDGIEWFGIIIIIICMFSGIFAYIQETKNAKIMESFTRMVPLIAVVIRGGNRMQIPVQNLVVGDLIEIKMGDRIPADTRIIQCHGLGVENSSITGESEPLICTTYPTDDNLLESRNVVFFSCYAVAGQGKGIVIATGNNTFIGRMASLTSNMPKTETPIAKEIHQFVNILIIIAIACGVFFFFMSLLIDGDVVRAFTYFLGIIIANVPEVLLITVTTSLTITAKKMASKNCLVKNLESVETLGSTSIICSDKTGTLTQNKMTVSNVWFDNTRYNVPFDASMGVERDILMEKPAFNIFVKNATLCLRAEFMDNSECHSQYTMIEDRKVFGDASETGILKFCEHIHPTKSFREEHPKVAEVPFSSVTKYQLSIHKDMNGILVIIKGAPEVIIDFCSRILSIDGTTRQMTKTDYELSKQACTELAFMGQRVLAYCDYELSASEYPLNYEFNTSDPENYNFPTKDYRFVGFVSLLDPPRPFVNEAVYKCRTAGIKVIMVTGDHPVTAIAIARKVGIISEGNETRYEQLMDIDRNYTSMNQNEAVVITGNELRTMSSNDLDYVIKVHEEIVFARTSPQQKLLIVESCQRLGEIVAVTGDGVNDSPALRKADIGVAMGITGSDVAKNAADMILLDDNFASIVTGVEEGRLIFDNLKKSIAYTLTSSVPEMLPMLTSILFSIPLPFVIELVLCVDVGTDLLPAIALAYEKAESDIMSRAPRNPQYDKLVNKRLISMTYGQIGMTQAMAGFCTYFCILMFHGFMPKDLFGTRNVWENQAIDDFRDSYGQTWDYQSRMNLLNEARTGYFLSIVITQMVDLLMCKTRRNSIFQQGMGNWVLNFAFIFEIILTGILLYTPGTEKVLKTMPLDLFWYWPCLPLGCFLWIYDEMRRWWIREHPGGFLEKETYY
ncbi:PREDICTED: sodium/potassium-transporting ATPase subunit alpha-like [Ceratosolen solmsi marchali]|uniref:Sodium/potassium-transporting ATPase subunit alpha n=1 Tax=Ceratosolen solmsi marchali TaxID=326594 RepID=A0AAJ6YUB7_9HYME|nr:PREDICTED: sodium/potassium-transporting ATPase subunit alpha-like [Ceratosolen solmsi marchali]